MTTNRTPAAGAEKMTELLPCPFCAHEAQVTEGTGPFFNRVQVECSACRIATFWLDEDVARQLWNRRALSASKPAVPEGSQNSRCPDCFGAGVYAKASVLPEPPDVTCSRCNGRGTIYAAAPDAPAAQPAADAGSEREAFAWPSLPDFPESFAHVAGHAYFTEHQMQAYANAYGKTVRAAASAPIRMPGESEKSFAWRCDAWCDKQEYASEQAPDQTDLIRALQNALFYWMPRIAGDDSPAGQKAAEHAYLLIGLDDNSTECWGDQILRYVATMNQQQEKLEIVLRDAGCDDGADHIEFIEELAARAAASAQATGQAVDDSELARRLTAAGIQTQYMTHAVPRRELWLTAGSIDVRKFADAILATPSPDGAQKDAELSGDRILEAMRPELDEGDGGYICDMAPERVIAAGRALLAASAGKEVK